MISLGCDKNRVDSEKMLSNLLEKYPGSELTDDPAEADITVINTCAFIGDAKEESINTIIENGEYKETGRLKKLIVAGCLAERYREEIRKELPEVDDDPKIAARENPGFAFDLDEDSEDEDSEDIMLMNDAHAASSEDDYNSDSEA